MLDGRPSRSTDRTSSAVGIKLREEEGWTRDSERKPSAEKGRALSSADVQPFQGRTFWVEARSCRFNDDNYKSMVQRLEMLGAAVSKFLDVHVDCVVIANPETPSAPSTPTGISSSAASARGISARAHRLAVGDLQGRPMGSIGQMKTVSSRAMLQPGPAQFAENHGKQVWSARELVEHLQVAERRREKRDVCGFKRSRKERETSCLPTEGTLLPKTPRHAVRVRGVEVEFCKKGPGVPEWWHFPECDRHYYYAPDMAPGKSKDSKGVPARAALADKKNAAAASLAGTTKRTAVAAPTRGGYCALCKVKHDEGKKHADSSGHRQVVQRLLSTKSEFVVAPNS